MAIDGSFCLETELARFTNRCPNLAHIPRFSSLLDKGKTLTEEEVVNSMADLFIHPNYTIPLVGCFRPIVQKVVDRAVTLLSVVPNLRCNSEDYMEDFEEEKIPQENGSVIDFYVRNGRGLNLHGLACLAFARAVDLAPFLLGSVLNYFKFAPPPFKRIMQSESVSEMSIMAAAYVLNDLRASYRLLLAGPEVFPTLWDWSCFLDFVQQSADIDPGDNSTFSEHVSDIRWSAMQILSIILKTSDKGSANFGLRGEEAFACLLRWQEFCQDVSLERAGWYVESIEDKKSDMVDTNYFSQDCCLQYLGLGSSAVSTSKSSDIERSNRAGRQMTWDGTPTENPFVMTSTVKKSFERVLLAVTQKWPVLLYGPAGAGKTALISKLARDSHSRVLSIHMDEQIDGKTLLGSYVCTERPGEFRWQPGSLTQAVLNGYWIVFENIDKAPSDVQSILLPLLEGASSFSTGHGEAIKVAECFRLFSTISSSKLDTFFSREGGNSLGALWRRVMIGSSSDKDLQSIVTAWYPDLEPLAGMLIETFERANQPSGFQFGGTSSSVSRFSLRDLLKWCKRIASLGCSYHGVGPSNTAWKTIYQEAVDIFAAFSTSAENRLTIRKDIAKMWTVAIADTETLYPANKPVIQDLHSGLCIGRTTLQFTQTAFRRKRKPFVEIRSSLHVLERIACSVKFNEPVLLVGETGTGKTTLVQNLAMRLGQKLTVLNLSQQSDVADLLGGFKPMNAQFLCIPLYKEFENLFAKTFSIKKNEEFLARLQKYVIDKNWKKLFRGFQEGVQRIVQAGRSGSGKKRKRPFNEELLKAWENFSFKLDTAHVQISSSSGMIFSFVEGAFVTALRNGDWILLDEVNLAPPETLQRVIGVLEEEHGSLCLAERGDVDYIRRHPNFRIFACMNPATDAGKRDLPFSLRGRFTEYFVDDVLDDDDLILFVNQFLDESYPKRELVDKVVHFYKAAKKESEERLQDSANQKPQYSLRSLYRALEYTKKAVEYTEKSGRKFDLKKALYDGFCMFFLTLLDQPSAKSMNQMILSYLLGGSMPKHISFDHYLVVEDDSSSRGLLENYVLTKSVKEHLTNLARAIFIGRYPVLLQGPTSSGKTSLVQYLATITGHEFVRINNHEHTDLQEYLGSYITDASGKLVYQEGVLVKAVRNGYWIVLDELNLAPSDVLEALNRLLDDNRELFVPELSETIQAHPKFMLFATQNPPTFYGGRKMLSRAFRNRFVEIHVDEIPEAELSTILEKRCQIPESYAKKMIEVMRELQLRRQSSKVFAGKHGFITPRDLFRWADRFRTFGKSYEDLARDGYYLLAERLRDDGEKIVVQEVLERQLRVNLSKDDLYKQEQPAGEDKFLNLCKYKGTENLGGITWTNSMWRLYFLVERCYKLREPVLLVGETGGGKTTVCQLLSAVLGSRLHILNCHQYTETSDFLGGFYPVRERSKITSEFKCLCQQLMLSTAFIHYPDNVTISSDIGQTSSTLDQLDIVIKRYRCGEVSHPEVTVKDLEVLEQMKLDLAQLHQKWRTIFVWHDGPLVQAMKSGDLFLVDEISLADDSVLERLNSVLEPERKLSLAEKGGSDLEKITAHPNFFLLATMNPGGDYGKKELSPALRNRFTEIWVPPVSDLSELKTIALGRISNPIFSDVVDPMLKFWEWFNQLPTGRMLTVRDLLSWVAFINMSERNLQSELAFIHGAFLVLLDGLSLGTGISKSDAGELRERCLSFLLEQIKVSKSSLFDSNLSMIENYGWGKVMISADSSCHYNSEHDNLFGIHPFYIEKGYDDLEVEGFEFMAPTTRRNALRVLRAMQLAKPVLLEGSPGVGKTSLIVALGKFSGHKVVRINLSEQTDIMDLLGSDLPIESDEGMQFAWSDGILLQALKSGSWVLLDELNLAPQSVLEGLNAILDHRAEVFIPELGLTYKCPPSFRVFACQNPSSQGGGRKGLPKSFLNRFTKVYVDELIEDDYVFICSSLYPSIPRSIITKLILFNRRLHEDTMLYHKFAQDGSPWEFNLRDVIRSCQIIQGAPERSKFDCFLNTVYVQRMRTAADRSQVVQLYQEVFGFQPILNPYPRVELNPNYLIVGKTSIKRNHFQSSTVSNSNLKILPGIRHSLEAASECMQYNWMCILVGPPSSGKTSLIRLLAQLTGNVLNELHLSPATDISELLGCFEQYNAFRNYQSVIARVECYVNEYRSLKVEPQTEAFLNRKRDLTARWLTFISRIDNSHTPYSASAYIENWTRKTFGSVSLLVEIIEHLRLDLEENMLLVSWSCEDLDRTLKTISKLQEDHQRRPYSAKFEWVTGLLIKALENGEWVVLENANFCNPTVLDRINSLVEPCGSITVNERGTIDGKPMILHPHPQFRMFLTVNPSYGEVSRAMRNRGVEIYMMQPYWLLEDGSGSNFDEIELKDVKRFLILVGIPLSNLVDSMAKAHIYAKSEGLRLNVHISYLELARWVQLFQQLLTNGNRPMWSLQISWEHTYLSSLGEAEGKDVVSHACTYFSESELYKFDTSRGCSLCLPGGWPVTLKLRDFVWYSNESSVKQNCMYLEFLGAQNASYTFAVNRERCPLELSPTASGLTTMTYLIDMKMLQETMFLKVSTESASNCDWRTEFDVELNEKKLWFVASWTIEQASERDIELYLCWFSWFGSRLQPFCCFFGSFLTLFKQELEHPIWNFILHCRRELMSHHHIDLDSKPLPMLSMELVDLCASSDMSISFNKLLGNSINCVGLLRRSFRQWNTEAEYDHYEETQCFVPLLKSLRRVEEEVLHMLVESSSFDVLFHLYTDLLEDHISFWNCIKSSQFEGLLISWRSIIKDAEKLKGFCPRGIQTLQMECKYLDRVSPRCFHLQKSLLWVNGGHPFLPSSGVLYQKQRQLLNLCESFWPRETKSWKQVANDCFIEAAVSSNPELRFLAMQGVSMSSNVMSKEDEDEFHVVQQLEDMYQMLLRRFEHEKHKLEVSAGTTGDPSRVENFAACCVFPYDILGTRSGFDSWQDCLPINDNTSLFRDMELLHKLPKMVLLDGGELQPALSCLADPLESALNFSLNFSSRPPTDFSPHQNFLWTLDAWTSVDSVTAKIRSFVLEMWFRWHSSLWTPCPVLVETFSGTGNCEPEMLFQPVKMASVVNILESKFVIKDYSLHKLKLRAASHNLWLSAPPETDLHGFLLSAARSLFQQIIFAHRKSFEVNKYAAIRTILHSFQENMIKNDGIHLLVSLLASSSHHGLTDLMGSFIEPLLGELYLHHSSREFLYHLGCAWIRIGGLSYHLLVSCDDLDPAAKYSFKYSQLMQKIALLELEIEVRNECNYLAGGFSLGEADKQRRRLLENLKSECQRIRRKIVFRSDPGKFKKLKYESDEFLTLISNSIGVIKNVESMDIQQITDRVLNWQETAMRFIGRLSNEYPAYIDIVQPVQVAIYEMKLGLSLVHASALQKKFLEKIRQDNMDGVLETIYSFMRFPRGCASKSVTVNVKYDEGLDEFPSCGIDFPTNAEALDINTLENLVSLKGDVSVLQQKAAIHQNILTRIVYSVSETKLMDKTSFMLLDKIFDEFVRLWINMKVELKDKADDEAQQYKFRPRAFKIEDIIEVDISTLGSSLANESFSEWQELISEEDLSERKKADEEQETLEEEWNVMQESILNKMVHIHNQLFGSMDLFETPGTIQVSDADRLSSFIDSYTLGTGMFEDFVGLSPSTLDTKLVPEHLLRLCLEHDRNFFPSHKSAHAYNFYKNSNAPVMSKMVVLVTALQQRIHSLLDEWDDHPALRKILDVIEMILTIPINTPLAKALSGLQFLLNRVRVLQETVAKFPISDQLEPISVLVSTWQKLEFESWPALLNEVQSQYEVNAGKLWFPLYSVLQQRHSTDIAEYNQLTIQSLEEFIQTSSIGEFRTRLQLLFVFHGQISTGIFTGLYLSSCQMENVKILYNIFGFYVQFLPLILEHIDVNRRSIETELKELLKLCQWERPESYSSMENSKKTRQKLKKIIQKYTDLLKQPVMIILNQEVAQSGLKTRSFQGPSFSDNGDLLSVSCNQIQSRDEDRSLWLEDWRKKVDLARQNLHLGRSQELDLPYLPSTDAEEVASIVGQYLVSQSTHVIYQEEWKQVWDTIDRICRTVVDCGDLWKEENKNLGKRRALSDLLKLLESCGLSKRRSTFLKDHLKSNQSSGWLLQPSYDVHHLLLTPGKLSSGDVDAAPNSSQSSCYESLVTEWKAANQYYFKGIASVHVLRQICLNFHKDFTLDQVNRSGSFVDHLIVIQQEQRAAAYGFAEHMRHLRKCLLPLENLIESSVTFDGVTNDKSSLTQNQHATWKCMWQQKQLFDGLCSSTHEVCLLLKTVENNHLETCQSIKAAASRVRIFIEKFLPDFQRAKGSLDNYLLGRNRVIGKAAAELHPCIVPKQMEELVFQNLQLIKEFQEQIRAFSRQQDRRSVQEALLGHFEDIFKKGNLIEEEYNLASQARNESGNAGEEYDGCRENISELEAEIGEALKRVYKHIVDAFDRVGSSNNAHAISEEGLGNITAWKVVFESYVADLRLDHICRVVVKTINIAGKLVDHYGKGNPCLSALVGAHLKHLHSLLDLILTFSDELLRDFLAMHTTVSTLTHVLANTFASLYSKGFGICVEGQEDNSAGDKTQDAKGTGMGEGAGQKDVSDEITDEDQLLGTSEKPTEEEDDLSEVPSKNDKGIEMEQDFAADAFSLSDESGNDDDDDNKDGEDEQLDSMMGKTGPDGEAVDEKLWDKDHDENPDDTNEKYESGPSVKDMDSSTRELRAKEDTAVTADEAGDIDTDELDKPMDENENQDDADTTEHMEDMNIDKEEAFADPTGLNLDETNQGSEDVDMDEIEGVDPLGDDAPQELDESAENKNDNEEKSDTVDEALEEAESEQVGGDAERDDTGNIQEENKDADLVAPEKDVGGPETSGVYGDQAPKADSATQPNGGSQAAGMKDVAQEEKWSNSGGAQNDLAPMSGLPNAAETEITVGDSSNGGKLNDDQPKDQLSQQDSSALQKTQPNPFRNIGDALEEWKERVRVSVDIQDENAEAPDDDMVDENAEEYGYASQFEKGTAQALGPATSDQIDRNVNGNELDADGKAADKEDVAEMEIEKQESEKLPLKSHALQVKNEIEPMKIKDSEQPPEENPEVQGRLDNDTHNLSESLVSMKRSYMSEDINRLGELSLDNSQLGKGKNPEELLSDMKDNATTLWRRYELLTTRLSQELAEQLRLVMEPTLASKLQGDYKTGKRINMKKVIPYIASHYRKDKIWLRRTRPNKRDYQVVIAIDDSRSMSESSCGDFAIEALVTVCRAMSQLEVGNFAVTSFGKKGNTRLLHDFDQPFTGEAGIKMISSLTFKQENTIADEPVVDLLKYLNNMLDAAVANARLPSGQNPLQQLVLIIADGRFHEKENLKRCVRDALSRKRMVAFLLLDSPQESIMDLMEASFQGGSIKFSKYLDSFPFPYYIVLKNIEALPRTLADLLRQWFELMQYSRD